MPKTVTIPGYDKPVDFPDSMSQDEVNAASKKLYEAKKTTPAMPAMSAAGPTEKAAMEAAKKKRDAKFGPHTPYQRAEHWAEGVGGKAGAAFPMATATLGAFVGGPVGAGMGGAVGTAVEQKMDAGKVSGKDVVVSGVGNALLEYVGGKMVPKFLGKMAAKASPRAAEIVNKYIGLTKTSLPKFGRTLQNATEIGKTVLEKVGIKPTLEAQRAAIESTRASYDDLTKKLVASPGGKTVDFISGVYDRAVKLSKEIDLGSWPEATQHTLDANLDEIIRVAKEHAKSTGDQMLPQEMHAMRKAIQSQIKDWNPATKNIRDHFLQGIYHDLNDSIARGLPTSSARAFLNANRVQSKLITARTAADNKLLGQSIKAEAGAASRGTALAKKVVKRAVVGAVVGGGASEASGHGGQGVAEGAALGAASAFYGSEAAGEVTHPRADVLSAKAKAALARTAAKLSKGTPTVVRALQSIHAIQSRPQNQP